MSKILLAPLDRKLAVAAAIAQANVMNGAARLPRQAPLQADVWPSIGVQAKGAVDLFASKIPFDRLR